MPEHVISPSPATSGWNLLRVDGRHANAVAWIATEDLAERVAVLLDRHGLEDTPLDQLPTTEARPID